MPYRIDVVDAQPTQLAAVAASADLTNFPAQIRSMFDAVYGFLKTHAAVKIVGHNVIIYHGQLRPGSRVEMGVQVEAAFEPEGQLISTETPAGRAARTVHVGPYAGLGQAHAAVVAWCNERHLQFGARSWEIYGDWFDDPQKLETEVFVLLA